MHHHHHEPRHAGHSRRRPDFGRGRGFRGGRGGHRARRGDVRAAVLALLAERPMHGYEMIKELEERTEGTWVPSAGSIYPTLQMLEDEGLIQRRGERRQAPLHPHRGRDTPSSRRRPARRPRGTRSAPTRRPPRSSSPTR